MCVWDEGVWRLSVWVLKIFNELNGTKLFMFEKMLTGIIDVGLHIVLTKMKVAKT